MSPHPCYCACHYTGIGASPPCRDCCRKPSSKKEKNTDNHDGCSNPNCECNEEKEEDCKELITFSSGNTRTCNNPLPCVAHQEKESTLKVGYNQSLACFEKHHEDCVSYVWCHCPCHKEKEEDCKVCHDMHFVDGKICTNCVSEPYKPSIEKEEWREVRQNLLTKCEKYPALVSDCLDSAYLYGLETKENRRPIWR